MVTLLEMTKEQLNMPTYFMFIHTPFCGTCRMARQMLTKMEPVQQKHLFHEMNASLFPEFMQEAKVERVPSPFITQDGVITEKVYTFHSIPNIYHYLLKYSPEMVTSMAS